MVAARPALLRLGSGLRWPASHFRKRSMESLPWLVGRLKGRGPGRLDTAVSGHPRRRPFPVMAQRTQEDAVPGLKARSPQSRKSFERPLSRDDKGADVL